MTTAQPPTIHAGLSTFLWRWTQRAHAGSIHKLLIASSERSKSRDTAVDQPSVRVTFFLNQRGERKKIKSKVVKKEERKEKKKDKRERASGRFIMTGGAEESGSLAPLIRSYLPGRPFLFSPSVPRKKKK